MINRLKISTLVTAAQNPEHNDEGISTALGGITNGVSTLEMAAAYAAFGNGGKYYEPYCYYKVTNSDGSIVYFDNASSQGKQIIGEDTADIMCELLQSVTTDSVGTGRSYKVSGFQTMAKTGTTSDDYDRWFVGGTPYYVAAVWYGYDLNKTVSNVSGNPSGKIFKKVMDEIHKNLPDKEFPKSSIVSEKKYCTNTGLIAGENCYSTATGWYSLKNMPLTCTSCTGGHNPENDIDKNDDVQSDNGHETIIDLPDILEEYIPEIPEILE